MRLVIVESPAKAKTINKYLGNDYKVLASYGHIRDLLSKDGSVDPAEKFNMKWEVNARGKKCVDEIVKSLKKCDELLLATDPDREGEAISWHISEVLREAEKLNVPYKRIVFHEITKKAIQDAIANPRDIDTSLVDAYLARRALDYLVGFTLSPILWRKLPGSKSAGRVQSVALRIIVDREVEIEAFKTQEYWTLDGVFKKKTRKGFPSKLTIYNGDKLDKFSVSGEEQAHSMRDDLLAKLYFVKSVEKKTVKRNPSPAFITSTLQQEASRKLGFSAKKTMQLAQNLYEGVDLGSETLALITYMRTDSIHLSKDAVEIVRDVISSRYGEQFLPSAPRVYQTKVKNAQEAHEAIRPVDPKVIPEDMKSHLSSDLFKLYDLIWKRTIASQMSSAELDQVQVDIADKDKEQNIFRATGSTIKFEGFLKVYEEGKDDNSKDDNDEDMKNRLPALEVGEDIDLSSLDAVQHFTMPPARFTEASLVKKLEELGIGRPSTYATILQVIRDRGYARFEKKCFFPEIRGRLVTTFLLSFFEKFLEYSFTADLEQSLDDVSNGSKSKLDILENFWNTLKQAVDGTKEIRIADVIDRLNEALASFLFANEDGTVSRVCKECGKGELSLKIGKHGSFIGCSRYPECNFTRKLDSSAVTDIDKENFNTEYPKFLGVDSNDNLEITIRKGPYGLYLQKDEKAAPVAPVEKDAVIEDVGKKKPKVKKIAAPKPIRASIPSFIQVDSLTVDLAIRLLNMTKPIGTYEGEDVKIGIGRFGPYVLYKGKYVSITNPEKILTITLDEAMELVKKKMKV